MTDMWDGRSTVGATRSNNNGGADALADQLEQSSMMMMHSQQQQPDASLMDAHLERQVCIQIALHHRKNTHKQQDPWSCYSDIIFEILAEHETMETYFQITTPSPLTGRHFVGDDAKQRFIDQLVTKIRDTGALDNNNEQRMNDSTVVNSIRRFYNAQLQHAREYLQNEPEKCRAIVQKLRVVDEMPKTTVLANKCTHQQPPNNSTLLDDPSPSRKRCVLDLKTSLAPALPTNETKRSKTSHDDTTSSTSSSSSSSQQHAPNPKRARDSDSEEETSSSSYTTTATVEVSERFQEIRLTDHSSDTTIVQRHLSAGWYRSAIRYCHDTLRLGYQQQADRERLVALWCVYARVLRGIGVWQQQQHSSNSSRSDTQQRIQKDWRDYAVATLHRTVSCPVVGNHERIALELAHLLVEDDDVAHAVAACRDGVRRCQCMTTRPYYCPIPLHAMDFRRMAQFELATTSTTTTSDPVSVAELYESFVSVMRLPDLLEACPERYYWSTGRAPVLLAELARLNKMLEQQKQQAAHNHDAITITTTSSSSMEMDAKTPN